MGNKIPWTKNHISTVADADGVLCVWTRAEQKVPKNIYIKKYKWTSVHGKQKRHSNGIK